MSDDKSEKKTPPRRPWRDNIEAITMAIIMAVMLKYFIIEAYKIPTGSMQPTLMGNKQLGLEDRILVDKLSYHFRDPERFEVVIFKYPLDRSKNFIKRIIGMPNERLRISGGDVWTSPRGDGEPEWTILRKPRHVQEDNWKPLLGFGGRQQHWKANAAAKKWQVTDHEIAARGDGEARYPGSIDSIDDEYKDGYPRKMAAKMHARPVPTSHAVGDLRIRGTVTALAGSTEVACVFHEGGLEYRCVIPGPAAPEGAKPRIEAEQMKPGGSVADLETVRVEAEDSFRLSAGSPVEFSAHNLDNQLELIIDGEVVLQLEIAPASGDSSVALAQLGDGVNWTDLQVDRDIYYTQDRARYTEWDIPENSYVVLGDNTQDSSDGREWQLRTFELTAEQLGEDPSAFADELESAERIVVRGNHRGANTNPIIIPGGANHETWFRDEWGELYHWQSEAGVEIPNSFERADMVPRHLITGKAMIVFWPIKPDLDAYRLKWIR